MFEVYELKPEFFFLTLNNIHFLRVFGKSLRNNAPPRILSSSPTIFPHATHASTIITLPMPARQPRHPRQRANHVTHVSMPPTLARQPRKHATHASMLRRQAHHPPHPHQQEQHAISQTQIRNVDKEFAKQLDFEGEKCPVHKKDYAKIKTK